MKDRIILFVVLTVFIAIAIELFTSPLSWS